MEPVDTSVIARAIPPPSNPIATIGALQGVAQGALQNKLLGQQVKGKIAMGQAAKSAVDPTTGKFDGAKYLSTLAADENGAFQVPEAAAQAVARQLSQMQLDTQALDLTSKRWGLIGNVAGSLLGEQKDPATGKAVPLTRERVVSALSNDLIGSGMFNSPEAVDQIMGFVKTLSPDNPEANRDALARLFLQSHLTTEGVGLLKGTPRDIDTGPTVQVMQTSPLTGETSPLASVAKGLPVGEAVRPAYQRFNPVTGQMETVLAGDAVAAAAGTGGNTAPPGIAAGPALGAEAGATAAATQAVGQLGVLQQAAEAVPQNKADLLNLRDQVGKFTTGPKANWVEAASAMAQQLGIAPPKVTEGVAAREEFNKLATQMVNRQLAALGGAGTDSKLASSAHGNPSQFMSKEGILNVTALMLGLEDATAAKNLAWQKWAASGKGPETYPQFVAGFNQHFNPRVFQSVYMNPNQRAAMLGRMDKKGREEFQKDFANARAWGWIE